MLSGQRKSPQPTPQQQQNSDKNFQQKIITTTSDTTASSISYTIQRYPSNGYNLTFVRGNFCPLGKSTNKFGRKEKWRDPLSESFQKI